MSHASGPVCEIGLAAGGHGRPPITSIGLACVLLDGVEEIPLRAPAGLRAPKFVCRPRLRWCRRPVSDFSYQQHVEAFDRADQRRPSSLRRQPGDQHIDFSIGAVGLRHPQPRSIRP